MNLSFTRIGILILCLASAILSIIYITPLVLPFILGWLIASAINPIVVWLKNWSKLPRALSILISLFILLTFILWSFALLFLFLSKELVQFSQLLPMYIAHFGQFLQQFLPLDAFQNYYMQFQNWYSSLYENTQTEYDTQMSNWLKIVSDQGVNLLQQLFAGIIRIIVALPSAATLIIISILSAFFISKDYVRINNWILRIIPNKLEVILRKVLTDLKHALLGFIKAQLTLISITSGIAIIGLLILKVENAFTIGMIAGAIDLLPYLGTGTLFIPWILYMYFTKNFSLVIGLAILYGLIIVTRQIIEPRILAKSIGLHPLLALIALFVGLQLFGLWGMFAGPFVIIILQALHRTHVYQDIWNYLWVQKK